MADTYAHLVDCLSDLKNFNLCAADSYKKLGPDVKNKIKDQFIDIADEINMIAYKEESLAIQAVICFFVGLLLVVIICSMYMKLYPEKYCKDDFSSNSQLQLTSKKSQLET